MYIALMQMSMLAKIQERRSWPYFDASDNLVLSFFGQEIYRIARFFRKLDLLNVFVEGL